MLGTGCFGASSLATSWPSAGTTFGTQGGTIGTPEGAPVLDADVPTLASLLCDCFLYRRADVYYSVPGVKTLVGPRLVPDLRNDARLDLPARPFAQKSPKAAALRRIGPPHRKTGVKARRASPSTF